MSVGDIILAKTSIPLARWGRAAPNVVPTLTFTGEPTQVALTFYRDPSNTAIIRAFGGPDQPLINITAKEQFGPTIWRVTTFFYYDSITSPEQIKWGQAFENQAIISFATLGVVTSQPEASVVPSSSTASIPSAGVIPSSTLVPTNSNNGTNSAGSNKGDLKSGAVAGVAIGCLIAGALIAGLIFWFCWGKRKTSRVRDYEASSTALMPHEKGFATNAVPLGSSPVAGALPLPLEDKAITGDISKISNSIKNHVQSYYQMSRVSPGLIDSEDIHALGSSQPISASSLSTMLDNSKTREIALRFCIAWAVCSRMHSSSDPRTSLLPAEVVGCFQKMSNEHRGSPGHTPSELARWRVTTAELMQGSYVRDPFTASDSRNGSIQAAVSTLENILQPFVDSRMDNGERKRNLEEILKRSALSAFTLFSQPSTWDFDWQEAHGVKSGELCIFPALVQLTNETGQPISPPRPFSEAVIRRLDE